jgi:hypothetical protein
MATASISADSSHEAGAPRTLGTSGADLRNRLLVLAMPALPALAWGQTGSSGGTLTPRTHYVAFHQGRPPGESVRLLLFETSPNCRTYCADRNACARHG